MRKNIKIAGLISFVLSTCLFINMFSWSVSAQETDKSYDYGLPLLSELNIVDANRNLEDTIPRDEFVDTVVKMLGIDANLTGETKNVFYDVPSANKYYKSISVAAGLGLISGNGSQLFSPNANIKYDEAVKIILTAMGYSVMADAKGGYPSGYLIVANELDFPAAKDIYLTRDVYLEMIFHAMQQPIMNLVSVDTMGDGKYEKSEDTTMFSEYHDIIIKDGIVTANQSTTFYGKSDLPSDCVMIDGVCYTIGSTNADECLGKSVTYFYREKTDSAMNELVYLESYDNSTLTFDAEDIKSIDKQKTKLTYYEANKERTVNFDKTLYIIYNGVAYPDAKVDEMMPQNGSVVLLDNNGDNRYEFIFVNDVMTFIVGQIDEYNSCIYDKYNDEKLSFADEDIKYSIEKNGKTAAYTDLAEYDVLSVIRSLDGRFIDIKATDKKLQGKISSITEEDDIKYVTVKENEYKVLPTVTEELTLNFSGTYYLDIEDNIAAVKASSSKKYGYLYDAATEGGLATAYKLAIVDSNNEIHYLTLKDKVLYNGKTKDKAEVYNAFCPGGSVAAQLVVYEADKSGVLTKIESALDNTNQTYELGSEEFKLEKVVPKSDNPTYRYLNSMLVNESNIEAGDEFSMDAQCKVFVVPESSDDGDIDPERIKVQGNSYFFNGDRYSDFKVYDYNEIGAAGAMVVTADIEDEVSTALHVFIVDKIATATDSEGNTAKKISGYIQGNYTQYFIDEDAVMANENVSSEFLNYKSTQPKAWTIDCALPGDVLQLNIYNKKVTVYRPIYSPSLGKTNKTYASAGGTYEGFKELECTLGKVEKINDNGLLLNLNGVLKRYAVNASAKVYMYDSTIGKLSMVNKNNIITASAAGIMESSDVLIYANRKNIQAIVIYE